MQEYLPLVTIICSILSTTGINFDYINTSLVPTDLSIDDILTMDTLTTDADDNITQQSDNQTQPAPTEIIRYENSTKDNNYYSTNQQHSDPQTILDFFLMDRNTWHQWRLNHLGASSNLSLSEFLREALYIDRRKNRYCINVKENCHFHFDYNNVSNLWYERRKTFFAVTSTFFGLIFALGLVGNIMAILTVMKFVKARSTTSAFILSLACADLLIILFCVPFKALESFRYYWTSGVVACKLIALIQHIAFISSILNMTAMSIERYFSICLAVKPQFVPTLQRTRKAVIVVWISAFILAIPCLFLWSYEYVGYSVMARKDVHRCVPNFTSKKIRGFYTYQLITLYLIPLFTMIYCYSQVIRFLYRTNQTCANIDEQIKDKKSKEKGKEDRKGRKKVIKMLVVLLALFAICWGPVIILSLMESFLYMGRGFRSYQVFMARQGLFCLAYFNSCLNPVVYCFVSRQFRDGFRRLMKCSEKSKPKQSDIAHISTPQIDGILSFHKVTSFDSLNSDSLPPENNKVGPEPHIMSTSETKFE